MYLREIEEHSPWLSALAVKFLEFEVSRLAYNLFLILVSVWSTELSTELLKITSNLTNTYLKYDSM